MNASDKKGERSIRWLSEKIGMLEARLQQALEDNSGQIDPDEVEQKLKALKEESMRNLLKLIQMSRVETVQLVEVRFEGNHQLIVKEIIKDTEEQLLYLDTLFDTLDTHITEVIKTYTMNSNHQSSQAKTYLDLIIYRLRLTCQLKPERVFSVVEGMVRKSKSDAAVFPIEECLRVCQEHKQVEASFLLNKKLGRYFEAVN